MTLDDIYRLVQTHGFEIYFPLAVVEGPIVTVIAGYFARLGALNLYVLMAMAVLADLVGDVIFYGLGRWGNARLSDRWRHRLHLDDERVRWLEEQFKRRGGRILAFGKLTHSAGFLVLMAAGMSRMAIGPFLLWNLLATIPKALAFVFLGYLLGYAYVSIDHYLFRASLVLAAMIGLGALYWFWLHRRSQP